MLNRNMGRIDKKLKKYLPQTTAGLVRYYEEDRSKVQIDPKALIAISFALIIIGIVYHLLLI